MHGDEVSVRLAHRESVTTPACRRRGSWCASLRRRSTQAVGCPKHSGTRSEQCRHHNSLLCLVCPAGSRSEWHAVSSQIPDPIPWSLRTGTACRMHADLRFHVAEQASVGHGFAVSSTPYTKTRDAACTALPCTTSRSRDASQAGRQRRVRTPDNLPYSVTMTPTRDAINVAGIAGHLHTRRRNTPRRSSTGACMTAAAATNDKTRHT